MITIAYKKPVIGEKRLKTNCMAKSLLLYEAFHQ